MQYNPVPLHYILSCSFFAECGCNIDIPRILVNNHFIFSAPNKPVLIKAGVIDAVLTLVETEMFAVTFKMLGVLRMLVDGQGMSMKNLFSTMI